MKHVAVEQMQYLERKNQVKFEFEMNKSLKKYDIIVTDCSDDLFDIIKNEITLQIIQQKRTLSYEIDDLPGINILLDQKNVIFKTKLEEVLSKRALFISFFWVRLKLIFLRINENVFVLENCQKSYRIKTKN